MIYLFTCFGPEIFVSSTLLLNSPHFSVGNPERTMPTSDMISALIICLDMIGLVCYGPQMSLSLLPASVSTVLAGRLSQFVPPSAFAAYARQHPGEFPNSTARRIALIDIEAHPRRAGRAVPVNSCWPPTAPRTATASGIAIQ